jgi:hypothetical protein
MAAETASDQLVRIREQDPLMWVWWGTRVELCSALNRRRREGNMTAAALTVAATRLELMSRTWDEIAPSDEIRGTAEKLLRVHDLRAGDGLQLAAAIAAAEGQPGELEFVSLDRRLSLAAALEGFRLLPP